MKRFVGLFLVLFSLCSLNVFAVDIPSYEVCIEQEDGSLRHTGQFTYGDEFDFVVKCDISDDLYLYEKYGYFLGFLLRTDFTHDSVDWNSVRVFIDGVEIKGFEITDRPDYNDDWVRYKYEVFNGTASFYETDWLRIGSRLGEENIPILHPDVGWSQWYGGWLWPGLDEFSADIVVEPYYSGDDTVFEIPVRYLFEKEIDVWSSRWFYDGLTDEFIDVIWDPSPDWSDEDLFGQIDIPEHDGYVFVGWEDDYRYVDLLGANTWVHLAKYKSIDVVNIVDDDIMLANGDFLNGIVFYDLFETARENNIVLTPDSQVEVRFKGRMFDYVPGKGGGYSVDCYFNVDFDNPHDIVEISNDRDSIRSVHFSTTCIRINKYDEAGNALSGCDFDLYKIVDGEWVLLDDVKTVHEGFSDVFDFKCIGTGSYKFVESVVPDGYKLQDMYFDVLVECGDEVSNDVGFISAPVTVDISLKEDYDFVWIQEGNVGDDYIFHVTNYPDVTDPKMPETGGSGIIVFIYVGVVVLLLGVMYLMKSRCSYF